ncbi:phosphotransferase [Microbacterium sp. LjRoot45]|uniref:phosphotransferase n=1 Tax=Microbacterium sp. LjRoot45 TaxID=3342329 RepID=UPI003ECE4590
MDATADTLAGDAPAARTDDPEADLLIEALDLPDASVLVFSREPLGRGTVAGFTLEPEAASASGLPSDAVAYVDTSLLPVAQETGLALPGVGRVWVHPADPHLPALAPAAFSDAIAVLLARLGVTDAARPEIVGYRPGRRAVLRVVTAEGVLWVKVVRPSRIERVVEAHTVLRSHGLPIPVVRGWSPSGLLVLESAVGTAATDTAAIAWHPERLLDAAGALREVMAATVTTWPARTSLAERLPWYVDRLRGVLPAADARVSAIASRIDDALQSAPPASVTIHGDLHLGQLFLDAESTITGLIDVDTAGLGDPADDAAAFIGHAVASALLTRHHGGDAARVAALADAAHERWGHEPRAGALTGVHLLGHALAAASGGDDARGGHLLAAAERALSDHKSPLMADFEGS